MSNATSNRVTLAYVKEAVFGVTPNNPIFRKIRYSGESLMYDIQTTQSNEIRDDRNVADTVQTKAGSQGDINFELSAESFDDFIQAAMGSSWTDSTSIVDNCDDAWNEVTNPNVTSTADSSDFLSGTASAKLVVAVGSVAGEVLAAEAVTSVNLTTKTHIRLSIKSSIDVPANQLAFLLDDTAVCASPIETLLLPALVANKWTVVTLPIATPAGLTAVISVGLKQISDLGAMTINVDNVQALPGTSTIKNGVTPCSFTVQKTYGDTTAVTYHNFRGLNIGSMSLDFASGSILTGKFSVMGSDAIIGVTQIAGAQIIDSGSDVPMNGVNNIQTITENGSPSVSAFKKISLNVDGGLRAQDAIGSLGPIGIALSTFNVTGSFDIYFSDIVMYNRFLSNASMALAFKAQDATGSFYHFKMPNVKIEKADMPSGGKDQDIMVSCTFRAIYDPVTMCTLQIDRQFT